MLSVDVYKSYLTSCYCYFLTKEVIYDVAIEKYAEVILQGNFQKVRFDLLIKYLVDYLTSYANSCKDAENKEISIDDTESVAIAGIYSWIGMFMTKELTDE